MSKKREYIYIDIFAGCGGMSLGLYNSGWTGLFAIEKNKSAFKTLQHNLIIKKEHYKWPTWLPIKEHDINNILSTYSKELKSLRGSIDLVVGGPPCQGFSIAGRRNENDHRNKMIDSYIKFIQLVKPRILFFENVKGFTIGFKKKNNSGKVYSNYVLSKLENLGYNVNGEILNFADFGIPQNRKRFILVGVLNGSSDVYFKNIINNKIKFLKRKKLKEKIFLKDAISDLRRKNGEIDSFDFKLFKEGIYSNPRSNYQRLLRKEWDKDIPDSHRFANHKDETTNKFQYIINNCSRNKNIINEIKNIFNSRKKSIILLDKKKLSPTLTTLPDDYIHYREPRILTVREYARIQSFNDWYEFKGQYTTGGKYRIKDVPRYSQVGNAIPPLFGEQSGIVLKEMV